MYFLYFKFYNCERHFTYVCKINLKESVIRLFIIFWRRQYMWLIKQQKKLTNCSSFRAEEGPSCLYLEWSLICGLSPLFKPLMPLGEVTVRHTLVWISLSPVSLQIKIPCVHSWLCSSEDGIHFSVKEGAAQRAGSESPTLTGHPEGGAPVTRRGLLQPV